MRAGIQTSASLLQRHPEACIKNTHSSAPGPDLEIQNRWAWGQRICIATCSPGTPLHAEAWELLALGSLSQKQAQEARAVQG